ncbi:MAG: tryptophan synthase subunit alpha [Chitinophagaceae bacterium]
MNRITALFEKKSRNVLNVYCTAGYPHLDSTIPVMQSLQAHGADLVELGMPYSDPLADGPVIQASGSRAIANGMTIDMLFAQLENLRQPGPVRGDTNLSYKTNADMSQGSNSPSSGPYKSGGEASPGGVGEALPVVLMGYMNPVLQYGFENFCAAAARVGIDGLILPDLPMFEFDTEYGPIITKYGLHFIFLVTPETSDERIRQLDERSTGFLYAVSSSSTTGTNKNFSLLDGYFEKLEKLQLRNPVVVGFGIKDKSSFDEACRHANGAIIGSAYIKALEGAADIDIATKTFLDGILG